MNLSEFQAGLIGLLVGAVIALIWADVVAVLRVVRGTVPERDSAFETWSQGIAAIVPRWLTMMVVVTGACIVLVGAFQIIQSSQFSSYVECQAERQKEYDEIQAERARLAVAERVANIALIDEIFNAPDLTDAQVKKLGDQYLKVAREYVETARDNPYPKPVAEVCK